jgi:putative PIN family toxin of toxin-antitoxin system
MKVSAVLDTNILISGIFWRGMPRRALTFARNEEIVAITSRVLLFELRDVLTREKGPFRLSSQEADKIMTLLLTCLRVVEPTRSIKICRDENDNHVLEVASDGDAQYIVSNDPDLQVLEEFEGIRIVDAGAFVRIVELRQQEKESE